MSDIQKARDIEGMVLFETYESDGNLLSVQSFIDRDALEDGDYIVRRAWSTAAIPELMT